MLWSTISSRRGFPLRRPVVVISIVCPRSSAASIASLVRAICVTSTAPQWRLFHDPLYGRPVEYLHRFAEHWQRTIDHRIGRGERNPKVARALERLTGKGIYTPLRQPVTELDSIRDWRAGKQIERPLRQRDVVPGVLEFAHHPVAPPLDGPDIDAEALQLRHCPLHRSVRSHAGAERSGHEGEAHIFSRRHRRRHRHVTGTLAWRQQRL